VLARSVQSAGFPKVSLICQWRDSILPEGV
jgi:hypothetical protein